MPSSSVFGVALVIRTAGRGCRAEGSWIQQTRSAGTSAFRKGRFAVVPARMDTWKAREKGIRPADADASAGAYAWAIGADPGGEAS